MLAPLKAVAIAIVGAIVLFIVTQVAFFFPFYMTVVVETFNLANIAANDNYIGQSYYDASLDGLRERSVFKKLPSEVIIEVKNSDNIDAIGDDDGFAYNAIDGLPSPNAKPYRQRGEPVTVKVSATYPLEMTVWGGTRWERTLTMKIPVSFTMTTTGLKYYKDLEWDAYP